MATRSRRYRLESSLLVSAWVHRTLIWHLIPLQHKLSTYRTSEDPCATLFTSNLSFRHLYHSINISSVPVLVPFAISHRFIVIWLQLKLQTSSPPSLDYSWTFKLNLEGVHHCIDLEELFGTGDQFSLFTPPSASPRGSPLSHFSSLSFGEKNWSFKGLNPLNSFSSLSSVLSKGRRDDWQRGVRCQCLKTQPIVLFHSS